MDNEERGYVPSEVEEKWQTDEYTVDPAVVADAVAERIVEGDDDRTVAGHVDDHHTAAVVGHSRRSVVVGDHRVVQPERRDGVDVARDNAIRTRKINRSAC